jgi:hypothetical protein
MAYGRYNLGRLLSTVAVLALLVGAGITTACLWYLGDWEKHEWGLTLALRIVWVVWVVVLLATVLTRVTIFGWSFRNYLRLDELPPSAPPPRRPTTAPWYKSGAASFSITVTLVSLTGAVALALAVLWILDAVDVISEDVFWLSFKALGICWWVGVVTTVLIRIAIFGRQKYKAAQATPGAGQPEQTSEAKVS